MSGLRSFRLLLVAAVYAIWGGGFVWLLLTGSFSMYLSVRLWPLMVIGAAVSLLLALGILASRAIRRREDERSEDLVFAGILLLPLVYLALHGGRTLDSFTYVRRSLFIVESIQGEGLVPARGDTLRTDIYRLLGDYQTVYSRPLVLKGALTNAGGRPVLFRFLVVCCLNDAVPKGIFIDADGLDSLPVTLGWR